MPDPEAQTATQWRNIETATGLTLADFTDIVRSAGVQRHGEIVTLLKSRHGLTHGNANLVALRVREALAGGAPDAAESLDAQYAGTRAHLRPVYERVAAIARGLGPDVQEAIQKTGVSFRRQRQFALVQAPSAKRVTLGLNLDATPDDPRVRAVTGMCSHRVDLPDAASVDEAVAGWIRMAYERAG
jgi:predicted transport protein